MSDLEQATMFPLMKRELLTPSKQKGVSVATPDVKVLKEILRPFITRVYPEHKSQLMKIWLHSPHHNPERCMRIEAVPGAL